MKFAVAALLSTLLCTNVHAQTIPPAPKRTPEQQAAIKAAIQEATKAEKARYVTKCAAKYAGPPRTYGQLMRQYDRCGREYDLARKNGTLPREKAWIRAAAAEVEKHRQEFLAGCRDGREQCEAKYKASVVPREPAIVAKHRHEP